jgi:hypothetical protein
VWFEQVICQTRSQALLLVANHLDRTLKPRSRDYECKKLHLSSITHRPFRGGPMPGLGDGGRHSLQCADFNGKSWAVRDG